MNTQEFKQRSDEVTNQILELLTEVEAQGLIEEELSETQGKINVKNAINKLETNLEALESVAQRHFKVSDQEEQLNG